MLEAEQLSVKYGPLTILRDVSFSLEAGEWLMVVGPNGAGKSTLMGAVSGRIAYSGVLRLGGRPLASLTPREIARSIGVVMQSYRVDYAFTVEEIVRLGRYAHSLGMLAGSDPGDGAKVEEALALTGLEQLRGQQVTTLSGGELQRTFLAQALAQDPKLLLLDEPTSHLDLVYQKQVFELTTDWLRQPGRAVASVVHDLSLARAYGTHALLLDRGGVVAQGPAEQVLTAENLNRVYQMDVGGWMRTMLDQWREQ